MTKISKNNQPIGVFDSGVGGLSVFIELKKLLPNEDFVFFADQSYVPYGEKSKKQLVARCLKVVDYFIKYHNIKLLVVACNTATCGAIKELRQAYTFPIVGTIPAVKVAAQKTKNKTIAVISTPSTSRSEALKILIKNSCQGMNVLNIGCKYLEDAVEEGELDSKKVKTLLHKYFKGIQDSKADYLVLGCTHYPFLKKTIKKIVGSRIGLLDSGGAIARHTGVLLKTQLLENKQKKKGETLYFTTDDATKFEKVASKLLKEKIKARKVRI